MATFLYRLGRFSFRKRHFVALFWVALLALAGAGAAGAPAAGNSSFSIPGTEAQKAFDLLDERFPGTSADGATARVVFKAPDGQKMTDPGNKAAVQDTVEELSGGSEVVQVSDPYQGGGVSRDGSIAYASVTYEVSGMELEESSREALKAAAEDARASGLTVEIGGDALQAVPETGSAEIIGIGVAAVVLVITLGSLLAAGLPLLTAIVGVGIGVASITALASTLDLGSTTSILASMIGLAVGIDYALFVVSRYRAELAEGRTREEAAGRAVGTAGSAVVFAGLTVVIALVGLVRRQHPDADEDGHRRRRHGRRRGPDRPHPHPRPARLRGPPGPPRGREEQAARRRTRQGRQGQGGAAQHGHPLGELRRPPPAGRAAARRGRPRRRRGPGRPLELGLPDDGSQPASTTQRRAYDLLSEGFGPGFNGPLVVVVDAEGSDDPQAVFKQAGDEIKALDNVVNVAPAAPNKAGDTATIAVIPDAKPSSVATEDLVHDIRAAGADIKDGTGADVLVTGATAMNIDVSQKLNDALVPYLVLVVGLAFLLLIVVFRSILVPLKAALGFLLSVLAALGAVVAVYQWGWLSGLMGVEETGPIMSMMPIFMVGVVFGLAMDYEVFLVTRIREAHVHGEKPAQAVVTGFRYSARVVDRRGDHHDRGVLRLHRVQRLHGQDDRLRPRDRRPLRRVRGPHGDRPGRPGAARREGLVAAEVAGPGAAQRGRRGREPRRPGPRGGQGRREQGTRPGLTARDASTTSR
ncbi:MMPL family transporter OS=Streptomyces tendae OX=1932 GN=F3L20_29070 PE=4 SV=1 [Streptomyces tendae]